MSDIHMEKIIFAIDNGHELHARMKFLKHIDIARAMGTLKGGFDTCIGYWTDGDGDVGVFENSYMMNVNDYERLVKPLGFTDGQVCVLRVSGDVRQPAFLEFYDGTQENVGPLVEIDYWDAKTASGWTYVERTGKYFTTNYNKRDDLVICGGCGCYAR